MKVGGAVVDFLEMVLSPGPGGGEVGNFGGADMIGGGAEVRGGGADVIGGGADVIGGGAVVIDGRFDELRISDSALARLCITFASCFGARFFFRMCPALDLERGRASEVGSTGLFGTVRDGRGGPVFVLDL